MDGKGSVLTRKVPVSGVVTSTEKSLLIRKVSKLSNDDISSPYIHSGWAIGELLFKRLKEHVASPFSSGEALICAETDQKVSFKDLLSASVRAARGWRTRGLKVGDTVAIFSYDDFTPEFLGALFEGLTVAFMEPLWKKAELRRALLAVRPRVIATDPDLVSAAVDAVGSDLDCVIVTARGCASEVQTLDSLLGLPEDSQDETAYQPVRITNLRQHVALIEFSSGGTGLPKPMAVSNYACYMGFLHPRASTLFGGHPEYTVMVERGQSWSVFVLMKLVCVAAGLKLILVNLPSPADMLRIIHKYQVNWQSYKNCSVGCTGVQWFIKF